MRLSEYDLGWVVGIFEGEGTITLAPNKRKPGVFYYGCRVVSVDEDIVDKLIELVPGSTKCLPNRKTVKGKQVYAWSLNRRHLVRDFLTLLLPHLGKRRKERAIELLEVL